jgi:hypothetical protein
MVKCFPKDNDLHPGLLALAVDFEYYSPFIYVINLGKGGDFFTFGFHLDC